MNRIKVIVPIPMDEAGVGNRAEQLPPSVVRNGFQPVFEAVSWGAALGDSYHDMMLMDWTVFQAGVKAEEEGFSDVLIDTVSDSGMRALRSRLNIPVAGPGESAFYAACMMGKKFSILTMWDEWFPLYEKTIGEYGLEKRLASMRSIETRPDVTELLAGKEEVIFAKLEEVAARCIEEDGADVIVLGSTTMHQSAAHLDSVLAIPVINPGVIAYKMLEMFIELDMTHSKKAFPAPEVPKDAEVVG